MPLKGVKAKRMDPLSAQGMTEPENVCVLRFLRLAVQGGRRVKSGYPPIRVKEGAGSGEGEPQGAGPLWFPLPARVPIARGCFDSRAGLSGPRVRSFACGKSL